MESEGGQCCIDQARCHPLAVARLAGQGKLHILAGAGGTGKTTLLIGLIATITTGGRWPDGSRCSEPGNALIWSSEDDPADTLIPRLTAAGADMSRVYIIQGRTNAQGDADPLTRPTTLPCCERLQTRSAACLC